MFGLRLLQKAPKPVVAARFGSARLQPLVARPAVHPPLRALGARLYSDGPAPLTKEFILERVSGVLSNCDKIDAAKIVPQARLEEDLGLDSLDVVDALFYVEEEFTVTMPDHEADGLKTVEDVVNWVYKQHDAF